MLLSNSFGEGTKQLDPPSAPIAFSTLCGRVHLSHQSSQDRIPFALTNCGTVYRLNIFVNDPVNENIYFGFGKVTEYGSNTATTDLKFQVRDPNGNVVTGFSLANLPTSGAGAIPAGATGYNQAVAGPNISGSTPTGYEPLVIDPTMAGNYYIEFEFPSMNTSGRQFETFDITVANGTLPILGRLWSKAWQLSSNSTSAGANGKTFSQFYVYSTDSIVTRFDCNGLAGGVFAIYCNPYGTDSTNNWENDRKSQNGNATVLPVYKLFLNNPDPNVFGTGEFGTVCDLKSYSYCNGTVDVLVKVNKPGSIKFIIDVDPEGAGSEDVEINAAVIGAPDCSVWDTIPWDGLDGYGMPVQNGATIKFNIAYLNGH